MYHIKLNMVNGECVFYDSSRDPGSVMDEIENMKWIKLSLEGKKTSINTKYIVLVQFDEYDENAF